MRNVIIFAPHVVLLDEIKVEVTRSFHEETGYAYKFWFDSWVTYFLMTLYQLQHVISTIKLNFLIKTVRVLMRFETGTSQTSP
jgi:hypothetical protein